MDIMAKKYDFTEDFIKCIDVLVDGEFHLAEKDLSIVYRGSRNQRIIDVKKSLSEDKLILHEKNDIRLGDFKTCQK